STGLLSLALLVGFLVVALGTFALVLRLRRERGTLDGGMALGCAGLVAGAVLFTFVAPFVLIKAPWVAVLVGSAFALRTFGLLTQPGRTAHTRKILLTGVSIYWFLFFAYEAAMSTWSESVSGAIRVDILVFYPFLFAVTAAGVWLSFDRWSQEEEPRPL